MHRKHLWVLICSLLLIPTLGWSEEGSDEDALKACLNNWGKHPFVEGNLNYRTIAPSVSVFGIGVSVQDDRKTQQPELVLIKPSVSVFSKDTLKLLNPQGIAWRETWRSSPKSTSKLIAGPTWPPPAAESLCWGAMKGEMA
jgi:hypothetical protein